MGLALDLAAAAGRDGDVPVGAVVLSPSGEVVGEGRNRREVDGALLVAGSSLTVMSGLRFVRRAAKAATPVVIVNRGETRGDPLATLRVHAGTSPTLSLLAEALPAPVPT